MSTFFVLFKIEKIWLIQYNVVEFKKDFKNTITVYVLTNDIERIIKELRARNLDQSELTRRIKDIEDELKYFSKHRELFDIVVRNDYTAETCALLQTLLMQKIRRV